MDSRNAEQESLGAEALSGDVPLDQGVADEATAVGSRPYGEGVRTPAERQEEADAGRREELAKQAKQKTVWRRILFWGVSLLVAVVAASSIAGFWVYLVNVDWNPNPIILSTWVAANGAQIIGLLVIITRHLFPASEEPKPS